MKKDGDVTVYQIMVTGVKGGMEISQKGSTSAPFAVDELVIRVK